MPGGQKRLVPSVICGTPMMSSGASWLPRSDTHGSPSCSANWVTSDDLPQPGGPQMKTGRTGATFRRKSDSCFCVTVNAEFICLLSSCWFAFRRAGGLEDLARGAPLAMPYRTSMTPLQRPTFLPHPNPLLAGEGARECVGWGYPAGLVLRLDGRTHYLAYPLLFEKGRAVAPSCYQNPTRLCQLDVSAQSP